MQLIPPAVQWPAAVETFDAANTDKLDKTKVPLAGSRTFRFPFVAAEEGDFEIPAISYAFLIPIVTGTKR